MSNTSNRPYFVMRYGEDRTVADGPFTTLKEARDQAFELARNSPHIEYAVLQEVATFMAQIEVSES